MQDPASPPAVGATPPAFLTSQPSSSTLGVHLTQFRAASGNPHRVSASPISAHASTWRIGFRSLFLSGRPHRFQLYELPPEFVPFFCYKDVAVLAVPGRDHSRPQGLSDFATDLYREWFPRRDRHVFESGLLNSPAAPFLAFPMLVQFNPEDSIDGADPTDDRALLLTSLWRWHTALLTQLDNLVPRFTGLSHGAIRLAKPGIAKEELRQVPWSPGHIEYAPLIRRSFRESFVMVEPGWESEGVRMVVRSEELYRRMQLEQFMGLIRDIELEQVLKEAVMQALENTNDTLSSHLSIWKGSLKDVMKAVLAGDRGREYGEDDVWRLEQSLGRPVTSR